MQYRTEGSPAPGDLVKVQGFVNTQSNELGIEDFGSPAETEAWLRDAQLWNTRARMSVAEHKQVMDFRQTLRAWVVEGVISTEIEKIAAPLSFGLNFSNAREPAYEARGSRLDVVYGELIATILRALSDGTWQRLKCCKLDSCRWCYYDNTRSRTRNWCSMQTCGSRAKSRAYYQRQLRK